MARLLIDRAEGRGQRKKQQMAKEYREKIEKELCDMPGRLGQSIFISVMFISRIFLNGCFT